tara:strand:+ start:5704 stop:6945 length:1242 start_codon:yes stop_codon:yes gene_type:complete
MSNLEIIPDKSHTFSKAYHQYPNGISPKFARTANGVEVVTDIGSFTDWSMGLGPIIKGYNFKNLNDHITSVLNKGVGFSIPGEYEFDVASKLLGKLGFGEQVRFARNGSDVTSAAVRLARYITKKDLILCNGYHGWQDWYIGATTRDYGVPKNVKELTKKIAGFDKDDLVQMFKNNRGEIACLIIEPMIADEPDLEFLTLAKELCHKEGALLIFDECWTGFRCHPQGAIGLTGIEPDLACYAKALGNGVPVSAVVGKKENMEKFQDVFFSFTHASDPIGLAAADFMLDYLSGDFFNRLNEKTNFLKESIANIFNNITNDELGIDVRGYCGKIVFFAKDQRYRIKIKTAIQKHMIENKHLFNMFIALAEDHRDSEINSFLSACKSFVEKINVENFDINKETDGFLVQDVFRQTQ